jgi:GT2 family glycosyltransferase
MKIPEYSVVLPTYRRPDVLVQCLDRIAGLDYPLERVEVVALDNGGPDHNSAAVAEPFRGRLNLTYVVNEVNGGYGFSVNRGLSRSGGRKILILNDDAMLPPSFLRDCDATFASDPAIGCLGCRVIEKGYLHEGRGIGRVADSGDIVANFDQDCGRPIEVEHVYGFCYTITRRALDAAGLYDRTLLAKPYSSGNRIETDHCLSIRRAGLKVVYDPRIVVEHFAKPRADYSERSLAWKLNYTRNTLYLFLKHYGILGKKGLALRYALARDVGILSLLRRPSRSNLRYFLTGLKARASGFGHYLLYLAGY